MTKKEKRKISVYPWFAVSVSASVFKIIIQTGRFE